MSDTPRTDALQQDFYGVGEDEIIDYASLLNRMTAHARQLERELHEAHMEISKYRAIANRESMTVSCLKGKLEASERAPLIRRLDDALSFGTSGREALPNLLKDCKAALEALGL